MSFLPSINPMTEPQMKGVAMLQFMSPVALAINALPADTMAMTPRVVATIDCMGRLVNFLSAGTSIKPPPTPSKPDKKPVVPPVMNNTLRQERVHVNFPVSGFSSQSAAVLGVGRLLFKECWACTSIRMDTKISSTPNPMMSGLSGI